MNIANAIRGARNPMNSWDRMDSYIGSNSYKVEIGPNDMQLLMKLRQAGADHRKYLRQIFVSVEITAPWYWWKEFDTYKVATTANSCSTMHKIHSKPISMEDISCEKMSTEAYEATVAYLQIIEKRRQAYLHYANEVGDPIAAKRAWYDIIQMLPSSYNQMRMVTLNYENLIGMHHSRKNHKLDEWHELCVWIEGLPYANELILGIEPTNKGD